MPLYFARSSLPVDCGSQESLIPFGRPMCCLLDSFHYLCICFFCLFLWFSRDSSSSCQIGMQGTSGLDNLPGALVSCLPAPGSIVGLKVSDQGDSAMTTVHAALQLPAESSLKWAQGIQRSGRYQVFVSSLSWWIFVLQKSHLSLWLCLQFHTRSWEWRARDW